MRNDAVAARKVEAQLEPAHVQDVVDAMYGVVNEGGTGAPAMIPGLELCGKTGTAQLASLDKSKAEAARHGMNLKENAWLSDSLRGAIRKSWWSRCSTTAGWGSTPPPSCGTW